ncbi:MAG: PPOX class F420-dependent oxidoreductase [Candidatus Hodarchaeales archaeon]|jgi:PPOX class probable F420-dependent enzyme
MNIEEKITELSGWKNAFAHLATTGSDCTPQSSPVWFNVVDGYILVNTDIGRIKDKNMQDHPKVAISIVNPENSYSYMGIKGEVVERIVENDAQDNEATRSINTLAKKYLGKDEYPYRSPGEVRVLYKIKPLAISGN